MSGTDHYGVFGVADRLMGVLLSQLGEVCVVSNISRMMDPRPGLLGVIALRDMLVPLLDVPHTLGLPARTDPPAKAAILRHNGRIAAMAVDDIVALTKATPREVANMATTDDADRARITSGFLHGSDIVSCLDVAALFERPDIVTTPSENPGKQRAAANNVSKLLIVSCGGASFAIDAIRIHATVPRRAIDTSEVSSPFCLGFITNQGWKVPVVDGATALGLGRPDARTNAPIVVLRIAEGKLLGLAVDSMERIALVSQADIQDSTAVVRSGGTLKSVFVSPDGIQTHVVDMDALSATPDLAELATLATRSGGSTPQTGRDADPSSKQTERQKYLLFRADRQFAAPTSQIARILTAPEQLVPTGDTYPAMVQGLFEVDNRSVPLVTLGGRAPQDKAKYVLLVGTPGRQIGVLVERIDGVLNASWRGSVTSPNGEEELVELQEGAKRQVVPVAELGQLASALCNTDPVLH